MTIPTLIANTRSQQYRSKLKKTISTISQAAKMSSAQYGFDFAGTNEYCTRGTTEGAAEHPEEEMTICAIFNGTLSSKTYYNTAAEIPLKKKNTYYTVESATIHPMVYYHAYVLSDGTIIGMNLSAVDCSLPVGTKLDPNSWRVHLRDCWGFIDVNGTTPPNKEVTCSDGPNKDSASQNMDKPCIVKNDAQHMTDVYPIAFYNDTVGPGSDAAAYVFQSVK